MFKEIIGPLIAFAIVLILCYYTTKLVSKKFTGSKKNKTMKVIETLPLGLDRCLYLILVGKKYFLFYSSKKGMELVSEIEMEEQPEGVSQEGGESTNLFDFKKIFDTYSGLSQKTIVSHGTNQSGEGAKPETTGILKSIERLKNINNNKE